jgi:nitroreductase
MTCPARIHVQEDKEKIPGIKNEGICISCGHCVAVCPNGAISHSSYPAGSVTRIDEGKLPSFDATMELIRSRRSVRVFEERRVEKETIEKIIEGARFAASGHNDQSTRYIVIQDKDVLKKMEEMTIEYLALRARQLKNPVKRSIFKLAAPNQVKPVLDNFEDFEQLVRDLQQGKNSILYSAPALILFHSDRAALTGEATALLALQNACLAAHSLGLGGFIAGFTMSMMEYDSRIPGIIKLPDNHQVYGALAVGYPKVKFEKWVERKPARIEWM